MDRLWQCTCTLAAIRMCPIEQTQLQQKEGLANLASRADLRPRNITERAHDILEHLQRMAYVSSLPLLCKMSCWLLFRFAIAKNCSLHLPIARNRQVDYRMLVK